MYKSLFVVLFLTMQGCWFGPECVYLEFDSRSNTINVLSEDYYIRNIKITEYIQQQGSIHLLDSTCVLIDQYGQRGATTLSIAKSDEHYLIHGMNLQDLLTKKNLHYKVQLEKFENEKKHDPFDVVVISFVKDQTTVKKKYNSKIP